MGSPKTVPSGYSILYFTPNVHSVNFDGMPPCVRLVVCAAIAPIYDSREGY
jgi:hypothetical protein